MMYAMSRTKTKTKRPKFRLLREQDSVYFLKLVLLLVLGAQWLRITNNQTFSIPIPVGLLVGIYFVQNERFSLDRKIHYAILLVTAFISFWLPLGVSIVI